MNWELEIVMALGYLAAIGGQWLVAKKRRSGFAWGLGANAIWVGIGFYLASVSMMLFSALWAIPNWRGLRDWAKPGMTVEQAMEVGSDGVWPSHDEAQEAIRVLTDNLERQRSTPEAR